MLQINAQTIGFPSFEVLRDIHLTWKQCIDHRGKWLREIHIIEIPARFSAQGLIKQTIWTLVGYSFLSILVVFVVLEKYQHHKVGG